jgi:hypothetical protein
MSYVLCPMSSSLNLLEKWWAPENPKFFISTRDTLIRSFWKSVSLILALALIAVLSQNLPLG